MSATEKKILAVVTGVDTSSHVLEAAVERADRMGAPLVVLHVMPQHVIDERRRSRAVVREQRYDGFTFTYDQATESARNVAERAAQAAIGTREVPYTSVGRVGDLVSATLAVAADDDCEVIFLEETYPQWRRLVGRADRVLAQRFDGTIVRVPRSVPQNLKTTRQLPEG